MDQEINSSAKKNTRETPPVLNPDEDLRVTHPEWFPDPNEAGEDDESAAPSPIHVGAEIARPAEVRDEDRRSRAMSPLHVYWAEQFVYNNKDLMPTSKDSVCIGHRDGRDWLLDEEYDMWLPVEQDIFREWWFKFFERVRYRKDEFPGCWPPEWTPTLINSILDHARFLRNLSSRAVAVVSDHELVSFEDSVAPGRWLARRGYDKIIPADAVGVLYGKRATCKSFVAVELAAAIAMGERSLHGIELDYADESWVLYFGAEDAVGLQRRLRAACERRAPNAAPRYKLLRGQPIITDPVAVQELVRKLKRAIPAGAPVALIVIDTYNLSRGAGEDENSADSAGRFVAGMKLLDRAFPGATVAVVHHENRQGTERGSLALGDNSDFMFRFEREAEHTVKLTCAKQKGAAEPLPLTLGLAASPEGLVLVSVETGATTTRPREKAFEWTPRRENVLHALYDATRRGERLRTNAWAKRAGHGASTVTAVRDELRSRDHIVQQGPPDELEFELTRSGTAWVEAEHPRWKETMDRELGRTFV